MILININRCGVMFCRNTLNCFIVLLVAITTYGAKAQQMANTVKVAGAMKNAIRKGEVAGVISLDTIKNRKGLYGIGPVEYLTGELLIIDGRSYQSSVVNDSLMVVKETYKTGAPFFVYANVVKWDEETLPSDIVTTKHLEEYLDNRTENRSRPFVFKLSGTIADALIHLQNLPHGTEINSPEDAHRWKVNYALKNRDVEIVGFFSTQHQGIFTHHDSFLHMHLITKDKGQMGHLDEVTFAPGMRLYLSIN